MNRLYPTTIATLKTENEVLKSSLAANHVIREQAVLTGRHTLIFVW